MKNKYLVFIIQAYDAATPEGRLIDVATVEVIEDTLDAAMDRARKIITKKFYRVYQVIENFEKS